MSHSETDAAREGGDQTAGGNSLPSNNVQTFREGLMMSKAELARKAGLSTLTIDRVEAGRPCRLDTKRKILLALGLRVTDKDRVFGLQADLGTDSAFTSAGTEAIAAHATQPATHQAPQPATHQAPQSAPLQSHGSAPATGSADTVAVGGKEDLLR